jgi:hypothetical protein
MEQQKSDSENGVELVTEDVKLEVNNITKQKIFIKEGQSLYFNDINGICESFSPGMGVVFTFGLDEVHITEQYIIGYERPNSDSNNQIQLCLAIGGYVGDSKPVMDSVFENIMKKTNNVGESLANSVVLRSGQDVVVYNKESSEGWDMSYVYLKQHSMLGLESLKTKIQDINNASINDIEQNSNATKFVFDIYKFGDILEILSRGCESSESSKAGAKISSQLTGELKNVVVFDNVATPVLFSEEIKSILEK